MMEIKKNAKKLAWEYLIFTLGLLIYTFAWSAFLLPSKIIGGGVSGLSGILNLTILSAIPVGVMNFFFNSVLLLLGIKFLGSKFGGNTIYGIVVSSLFFIMWQQGLHAETFFDVSAATGFGPFMCALIGGALCGLGIGLTFSVGGNTGGTDIIALILSKYYNISPGKVIMFIDIVIIGCSFLVEYNINKVVFGYIVMFTLTFTLDFIVDGNKQSYQIMVFSNKAKEIGDMVMQKTGRGATLLNGQGCYTKADQQVLMIIAHKVDKAEITGIIRAIDPQAFVSVAKVQGVYGKNFDALKK